MPRASEATVRLLRREFGAWGRWLRDLPMCSLAVTISLERPMQLHALRNVMVRSASAGAILVSACTASPNNPDFRPPPSTEPIVIESKLSPERATAAIQRAALDSGFVVTETMPGVVKVGPYLMPALRDVTMILRANIAESDSGSTILITGTAYDPQDHPAQTRPIVPAKVGRWKVQWQEFSRFIEAVRGQVTTATANP